MISNIHYTPAEWAAFYELPPDFESWIAELDSRPLFAPDNNAAPLAPTAPIVVSDEDEDEGDGEEEAANNDDDNEEDNWAYLRANVKNESGTYYSYSAKPGGANRKKKAANVRVYTANVTDQAFAQKGAPTLARATLPELQSMAQDAGVAFDARTPKLKLAERIVEKEKPTHLPAVRRAEVVRLKGKWGGEGAEEGMWFFGEMRRGRLEMRKCSRKEVEAEA